MSNLWKLYGLAYTSQDFYNEAVALAKKVRPRDFTSDPKGNDKYHAALVEIDKFLVKWYSPLDHLDVQLFYDLLCCQTLWDNFANVLKIGGVNLKTDPADPEAGAFWQVLGLACLDPWKNKDNNKDVVGFRQLLKQDIGNAERFGFRLTGYYKDIISKLMAKPEMMDALQGVAMCWDPVSRSMLVNRAVYPRLQAVEVPPGWIDLSKP